MMVEETEVAQPKQSLRPLSRNESTAGTQPGAKNRRQRLQLAPFLCSCPLPLCHRAQAAQFRASALAGSFLKYSTASRPPISSCAARIQDPNSGQGAFSRSDRNSEPFPMAGNETTGRSAVMRSTSRSIGQPGRLSRFRQGIKERFSYQPTAPKLAPMFI